MKEKGLLLTFILLTPFMIGAAADESIHSKTEMNYTYVTSSNAASVSSKYGYFLNAEFPTLTKGNEANWKMTVRFASKTNQKVQIRLLYVYGDQAKFKVGGNGCNYYTVYESAYSSIGLNKYSTSTISLTNALSDHGIQTDYRYKIFTASFVLGFYVDEHIGNYKGNFYYFYIPTTFNSGDRYHLTVGNPLQSSFVLKNNTYNQNEYHKRVFYGNKNWSTTITGIYGGEFVDWLHFQKEDRGERKTSYLDVPLKLKLTQFGNANNIDLPLRNYSSQLSLFIYDGYELFSFGEPVTGYNGEKGYKVPLASVFDGTYVTFKVKNTYYTSLDGRRVYSKDTVPSTDRNAYQTVNNKLPFPAIDGTSPKTIRFQVELLNVGVLGLVDITASFSYTISKNYFGSHKNSSYYVEETE